MGGFHHRVYHIMTGQKLRRGLYGRWVYPSLVEAIVAAGLQEVETYVSCRQNTSIQYIATRTILDLFLAADR